MRCRPLVITAAILSFSVSIAAAQKPSINTTDRIRLAEAFSLADAVSEKVWPGWSKAPFPVILVTKDYEFLIRHPKPSDDFVSLGEDKLLGSEVFYRKRQFSPSFLATFPAVGGISTIVVGQAENTAAKTSTSWVVTLLHEHFHQFQESGKDYFDEVNALGLSGGDQTGMWMLNYKFPYEREDVGKAFARMTTLLLRFLGEKDQARIERTAKEYAEARRALKSTISADEFRYFEFQMWKEGIARYTENRVAELAAKEYKPSAAFQALPDFTSFEEVAKQRRELIRKELREGKIGEYRRVLFYPIGGAEGFMLDRIRPGWQDEYLKRKFSLGYLFGE